MYRYYYSFSGSRQEHLHEQFRNLQFQNSCPYIERISTEDGSMHLVYRTQCRMDMLLCQFSDADLWLVNNLLELEYACTANDELDGVIRQAVENLKSLSPESGSLCAVPFNNGLHGLAKHGYPRISFACVEPDAFLREFHPRTDFDLVLGRSPLSSEDPTGDENVERILQTDHQQERISGSIPGSVLFIPIDRAHYEQILGLDVTYLTQMERQMVLAELVLTETLALLGRSVQATAEEEKTLQLHIIYQLSALYSSLRSHRYAEKMFTFEKSGDTGKKE